MCSGYVFIYLGFTVVGTDNGSIKLKKCSKYREKGDKTVHGKWANNHPFKEQKEYLRTIRLIKLINVKLS